MVLLFIMIDCSSINNHDVHPFLCIYMSYVFYRRTHFIFWYLFYFSTQRYVRNLFFKLMLLIELHCDYNLDVSF